MSTFFSLNMVLFAAKWVFVGLIYLVLLLVVVAVRREMSLRLGAGRPLPSAAPGKLRVLVSGTDPQLQPGSLLPLALENSLGASGDNTLMLRDKFISSHHARLHWDGANWWVEDLSSKNGTFLNEEDCVPFSPTPFSPGMKLRVGDMVFELVG